MKPKFFLVLLVLLILSSSSVSQITPLPPGGCSGGICIARQFNLLCMALKDTLPIVAFAMLLLAAIIYAAGQIMGAETRARASVWATAMVTGGIVGLLIAASASYLLWFFLGMFSQTPLRYDEFWCSSLYGTIRGTPVPPGPVP